MGALLAVRLQYALNAEVGMASRLAGRVAP